MRKWLWIATALLLAGCTHTSPAGSGTGAVKADLLIPAGTRLHVRLDEPLNTRRNRAGDSFFATLESPVQVDGATLVPTGTRFTGRVTIAEPSAGREGPPLLAVELTSFSLAGRRLAVHTNDIERSTAPETRHVGFITGMTRDGEGESASEIPEPIGMPADSIVTFALCSPVRM